MENWLGIYKKVFVVTGGSSGIGKSIICSLLNQGCRVANFSRTACDIQNSCLLNVKTDVTSKKSIKNAINETLETFGTIDGLVNNAGINIPGLLVSHDGELELSDFNLEQLINVNQIGIYYVAQCVCRYFLKNKKGVVINISSECGLEGSVGQSAYAGTKAAIYSFTRSWSKELEPHNIRVVGVAPGVIEETGARKDSYEEKLANCRGISLSEFKKIYNDAKGIPKGRVGKLSEVADLVCFLLSDKSAYITGTTINISGGKTRG